MNTLEKNTLCERLEFKNYDVDAKLVVDFIMKEFKKSQKEEIVIINIGTDMSTGDSYAPFLGSYLEEKKYPIVFYGTLEKPIHARNIITALDYIKNNHKNAFIIAIDAATSDYNKVGNIVAKNKPIKAGAGVRRDLPCIGDFSIIYNAAPSANCVSGFNIVRLGDILKAVKSTYKIFEELKVAYTKEIVKA